MTFSPPSSRATLRSALLGVSTGLRSQMGVAAVVIGPEGHLVPSVLRTRTAKLMAGTLAVGELVADKSSRMPDRTDPPALIFRLVLGAASAGLLARSEQEPPGPAASVGALAALAGTFGGFFARRRLSASFPSLAVAVAEDGLAVALATLAVTAFSRSR